jgi:hypothetical protein
LTLPPPVPRDELHLRRIEVRGYRRHDGLYDIEARICDTKSYPMHLEGGEPLAAGALLHDMWVRLVLDEELNVIDALASTDASPFPVCREAVGSLERLKGLRIGAGWSRAVKERLGRTQGCTHLTELLVPLATTAFQTLAPLRHSRPDQLDATGKPVKIDSCYAYASNRQVVMRRWPAFYDGPDTSGAEADTQRGPGTGDTQLP